MESFDTPTIITEKNTADSQNTPESSVSLGVLSSASPRHSIFGYTWKSRLIVFTTTLAVIGSTLLIALILSRLFSISLKTLIFVAVIISFPVTQYALSRILIRKN